MARDVHDIIAHTLAVVGVQLTVAEDTFDDDPDEARRALRTAQRARADAVAELRSLIGALRDHPDPAALVEQARATGADVALREEGHPAGLPGPIAWAVYRVIQEALTNAVKHAPGARTDVLVGHTEEAVHLTITTELAAPAHRSGTGVGTAIGSGHDMGGGHGITGMRERVTALGGTLSAGPADGGRFTVEAVIPVPRRATDPRASTRPARAGRPTWAKVNP